MTLRLRLLMPIVAAALGLALAAAPSYAGLGGENSTSSSGSSSGSAPVSATSGSSSTGTTATGDAGGCHLVSTSSFLGSYCPSGATNGPSVKQILAGEKYKECWDDPMTADELEATGKGNTEDTTWYFHRCIRGIDKKDLSVKPPVYIESTPVAIRNDQPHETIGPNERQLIQLYDQTIPFPIAVVSPTQQPRVGQWLSFADGQPQDIVAGSNDHVIPVPAGGVTLVAVERRIVVKPLGPNTKPTLVCPGGGHLAAKGEPANPGGNCWYRYERSSAAQTDRMYPVRITAYWTVYIDEAGTRRVFNTFTKSQTTTIPVTEIQAINVPVS